MKNMYIFDYIYKIYRDIGSMPDMTLRDGYVLVTIYHSLHVYAPRNRTPVCSRYRAPRVYSTDIYPKREKVYTVTYPKNRKWKTPYTYHRGSSYMRTNCYYSIQGE
jgi:hypothetical protein